MNTATIGGTMKDQNTDEDAKNAAMIRLMTLYLIPGSAIFWAVALYFICR